MKRILTLLLLITACAVSGQNFGSYTITGTNFALAGAGTNITANGTTRAWTNATTSTTILTNLSSVAAMMTNLYNAYGSFVQVGVSMNWLTSTQLTVFGPNLTLSIEGGWGYVTTNIASSTTNLMFISGPPWFPANTNRTNFANWIVDYAGTYATTNRIPTNAIAFSNLVSIGISVGGGTQAVYGPKLFHNFQGTNGSFITGGVYRNGAFTNGLLHATNGLVSDTVFLRPILTNGANYGNAFRSPGGGTGSEQFGLGASAATNGATAFGSAAAANGENSTSFGASSGAGGYADLVGGFTAQSTGGGSVVLGTFAEGAATNVVVLGTAASATHTDSGVLGRGVASSDTNQFTIGRSDGSVLMPGRVQVGTMTNTTFRGTNNINGELITSPKSVTSLVNGFNSGVDLSGSYLVLLSGPSGNYTNRGFVAGKPWEQKLVRFANATVVTIENQDGGENDTNRVVTGYSSQIVMTNQPSAWARLIYNGTTSRWEVTDHSR